MIGKNEIIWERLRYTGEEYVITSTPDRSMYFIYKGNGIKKLAKGPNPKGLEEKWVK